jgi:1,4-dihydroxy-2-naphthoate octaprenyltransferase
MSSFQNWFIAARPKTLPAAVAPVIVGTAVAVAEGGFAPLAALAAVAVALLLQVAANFSNDVFDFRRGADTQQRLGPARVVQQGLIPPERVIVATGLVIGLSMLAGLYLVWRGGWPILVLGLLAILSSVAYTGGPAPLGYLGLGDIFVFAFFGLVAVAGTAYVQTRDLTNLALLAAVPMGCFATAILVVNNLRDIEGDRAAGKRTLAVRLGVRGARTEYGLLLVVAYLCPPLLWMLGLISAWWWISWLTLPLAWPVARGVFRERGAALNARLAGTARLQLLFSVLFAGSIVL